MAECNTILSAYTLYAKTVFLFLGRERTRRKILIVMSMAECNTILSAYT